MMITGEGLSNLMIALRLLLGSFFVTDVGEPYGTLSRMSSVTRPGVDTHARARDVYDRFSAMVIFNGETVMFLSTL